MKIALAFGALLAPGTALAGPIDRWSADISEASARFGIPQSWIRKVILIESNGETLRDGRPIVSRAGAMGLMQLMPGTWRDIRSLLGLGPDPHNPADNILAGTFYLRLMYERFGYPGLFGAYNCGPARYAAYLAGDHRLPSETQAYLVAAAMQRPLHRPRPDVLFARTAAATPTNRRAPAAPLFVALNGSLPR